MGNKEKKEEKPAKAEYTLDDLRQNIMEQYQKEEQRDGEENMRDRLRKHPTPILVV